MKCIIVDDERHARENLIYLLKQEDRDIDIVGQANSVDEAYNLILKTNPDIVFLDISMPGKSGFDLLDMFDDIHFDVVFVTAYDEYALRAFEQLATAYILKPIDESILSKNLEKIQKNRDSSNTIDYKSIKGLLNSLNSTKRLGIPTETGLDMVLEDSILYMESEGGYTMIYFKDQSKKITSKRLSYFLEKLPEGKFMKIHQSFLVNLDEVVGYRKNGVLTLSNSLELPVSRSMRKSIYDHLAGR